MTHPLADHPTNAYPVTYQNLDLVFPGRYETMRTFKAALETEDKQERARVLKIFKHMAYTALMTGKPNYVPGFVFCVDALEAANET